MKPIVLFISHCERQCGVYQFGLNIALALKKSKKYNFHYAECSSAEKLRDRVRELQPAAMIYNYYPSTLPWLKKRIIRSFGIPQLGIIHEVTQEVANTADNSFFHGHIAPDPTLLLNNPLVAKTGRLVPAYRNNNPLPAIPTIGSFGFGTAGKGFEKLIQMVQNEFDTAIIRLHIPFAAFGDSDGSSARSIAAKCREIIVKPGIQLQLSHDFLSREQLLDFLSGNSLNAFFYEENKGRGISSVIDYALAVQRPVAITRSNMFRHITSAYPAICIEDTDLHSILENGFTPLEQYRRDWSEENLIWDYERAVQAAVARKAISSLGVISKAKRIFRFGSKTIKNFWVPTTLTQNANLPLIKKNYVFNSLPGASSLNRILDNSARQQYQPVINTLFDLLPDMMSRKIPEANIQQAFVLDTVNRFAARLGSPKMLAIGSYDDTAAAALKMLGFRMDEVDPVFNYDLGTFFSRPTTMKGSYDIIFATSVVEHVGDDAAFMSQIADLLAPNGVAVLTADFNDMYKPGDRLPQEDFRFYTQKDFTERLLPVMKDCSLADTPEWDCVNPDFTYAGCSYTFATFVVRKNTR